jgi:5-oxopent-3-ene-1,2,5-tricarboxylate decarboxylase / 2-hydroxyhepta-2,4-diene-1,7-dioate isomerase
VKLLPLTMPLATVYGSLMHHRAELAALGDAAHQPPYNTPPQAPVLYIKPANTLSDFDARIVLPAGYAQLRARACVGLFFKQKWQVAGKNTAHSAINFIANNVVDIALLCDLTVPHTSFHRPPVKFNAFDGSLGLPSHSIEVSSLDLQNLRIETWVNGIAAHHYSSTDWLTTASQHLQAVSELIAFEAGDVLMMGCPPDAPLVQAGDVVELRMNGHTFTRNPITEALP